MASEEGQKAQERKARQKLEEVTAVCEWTVTCFLAYKTGLVIFWRLYLVNIQRKWMLYVLKNMQLSESDLLPDFTAYTIIQLPVIVFVTGIDLQINKFELKTATLKLNLRYWKVGKLIYYFLQ